MAGSARPKAAQSCRIVRPSTGPLCTTTRPPRSVRTHPVDRGQQLPHSLNSPLLPVQRPSFGCARPLAAANLIAQGFHTYVARPDMCYGAPITGSGPAPGAGG